MLKINFIKNSFERYTEILNEKKGLEKNTIKMITPSKFVNK